MQEKQMQDKQKAAVPVCRTIIIFIILAILFLLTTGAVFLLITEIARLTHDRTVVTYKRPLRVINIRRLGHVDHDVNEDDVPKCKPTGSPCSTLADDEQGCCGSCWRHLYYFEDNSLPVLEYRCQPNLKGGKTIDFMTGAPAPALAPVPVLAPAPVPAPAPLGDFDE